MGPYHLDSWDPHPRFPGGASGGWATRTSDFSVEWQHPCVFLRDSYGALQDSYGILQNQGDVSQDPYGVLINSIWCFDKVRMVFELWRAPPSLYRFRWENKLSDWSQFFSPDSWVQIMKENSLKFSCQTLASRTRAPQTFWSDFTKKSGLFPCARAFSPLHRFQKYNVVLECELCPHPNTRFVNFIPSLRRPPLNKKWEFSLYFQEKTNISRTAGDRIVVRVPGRGQENEQSGTGQTFHSATLGWGLSDPWAILEKRRKSPDLGEPPCVLSYRRCTVIQGWKKYIISEPPGWLLRTSRA